MVLKPRQIKCVRILLTAFLFVQVSSALFSQSTVSGIVKDKDDAPVEFANVLLLNQPDSSLFRGSIVGADGRFVIQNIPAGKYMVKVAMTGFADYYSDEVVFGNDISLQEFGTVVLQEDAVLMNAVEVVAKKPLFEQRIDRMVVNVAASLTAAGKTALEVLERSPGVLVNHQSNLISLAGKNGVVVMINNRVQYMPVDAVVAMLEGMSADNIERIEIITTPPANFNAEGNAGYINIIMKTNLADGLNGSISGNFGYGKGTQGGANLNFNYRKGKANLYGDYNYKHAAQEQIFDFSKRVVLNNNLVETSTISLRDPLRNNHTGRLGLDLQLSKSTVVGVLASAYNTKWTMNALNTSLIEINESPDTNILIDNYELNQWKHLGGNVNLQHTFQKGQTFNFNADYLWYEDNNPTEYFSQYSDGHHDPIYELSTRSHKLTPFKVFASTMDYTAKIGQAKMETGLSIQTSIFTNDVGVEYLEGVDWIPDPTLTAKYDLDEEVLGAYGSLESPFGHGFTLKAGLRYEFSSSELGSEEQQVIVDRSFGEFFPSLYVSKQYSENYTITASYSKRITRPTFNDMAPFVLFLDPYTFFSGNPALQPAIAHKLGLAFNLKTIVINFDYTTEDSTIARYQSSLIPGTNKQLLFAENLRSTRTYSGSVSIPVTPVRWWNMHYNFSANYQQVERFFEGSLYKYEAGAAGFFTSHTFTITKALSAEITSFYNFGGLFGIVKVNSIGSLNAAAQYKFEKNGGTLKLGFENILDTQIYSGETNIPELNQYFRAELTFGQPTLTISYSQNFGKQSVKSKRQRRTGADEVRQRIE